MSIPDKDMLTFIESIIGTTMREDVEKFINTIGPDARTISIYEKLINEEYKEFTDSYWEADENRLNEAMDLVWVVLGYCIARGWDVDGAWKELTRANMDKLQFDPATGQLKRREDGKILKPTGWVKPDMTSFLTRSEEHG
jgi:predicted HAD superfamily Cof-like phosphohydrolase